MNKLQAYKELIEHLQERANRTVSDIQYGGLTNEGHKFYVTFDDKFTTDENCMETVYIKEER